MQPKILIVEDEPSIADNLVYILKNERFEVKWVSLGRQAIECTLQQQFDLVILDVGLPDISGFEVCKEIRKSSDVPILFLTARGDEIDRVVGLEIGGDDYVVKPFSPREVAARIKVIIRRNRLDISDTLDKQKAENRETLFILDPEKRQIKYQSVILDLTLYEYGILALLIQSPERVFTREQLMLSVWNMPEESYDRAVDTHIKTIRAKLKAINPNDDPVMTHRGVGYSLKPLGKDLES
ncbi:two-component system response regulator CreB [Catenovulum maritimum]|uniref:Transcriptional regulator n=1 Tax=Catenovulum maritimum TaxID=1513271 RepID=A0A0J8H138_9ALTE|nr:two-component system response regulator CreB [Catenovulum maritimum]KMT66733.1 transcriptional regulator [Catenovulum maritimum]